MSARALNWAFEQSPKTTSQKLVLLALADRADEDGVCYPGLKWITRKCSPINPETSRRVLRELSDQGLVEKVRRLVRKDGTYGVWLLRLPIDQRALMPAGEFQWEDEASGQECSGDQRAPVTKPAGTVARADSRSEPKNEENPDGFSVVLNEWLRNAPPLIKHRETIVRRDAKVKRAVAKAVEAYGVRDVVDAIRAYATVLASSQHVLDYRWSMHEFFTRTNALPKFLPEALPLENYLRREAPKRDRGVSALHILQMGAQRDQSALPAPDLDSAA